MAEDPKANPSGRVSRRSFLKQAGAGAAAAAVSAIYRPKAATGESSPAEATILEPGAAEHLGPEPAKIDLKINGHLFSAEVEPRITLLELLRDHAGLTGPKLVCDRGACGACTIHLDGKTVNACMILAMDARAHAITTIEGIGAPAKMHPVQSAFVEFDALQCGFCTPGMIMSIVAALERDPRLNVGQIKQAVAGNICRCGTYPHVFEAAVAAAKKMVVKPPRHGSA